MRQGTRKFRGHDTLTYGGVAIINLGCFIGASIYAGARPEEDSLWWWSFPIFASIVLLSLCWCAFVDIGRWLRTRRKKTEG